MTDLLVSCLCVTEAREAFMPWVLWNFARQTWTCRELVVVDSSLVPLDVQAPNIRVVSVPPGMSVPAKRNAALDEARGDVVAWFDDDDWQHPRRLELIVAALRESDCSAAGWSSAWFVDLASGRCAPYRGHGRPVFNGAGFRTDLARSVRFDERRLRASDSTWIRALGLRPRRGYRDLVGDTGFLWLCHQTNLSNPAKRRRFSSDLDGLRSRIGEAWGDTDEQLAALRERLGSSSGAHEQRTERVGRVSVSCAPASTIESPQVIGEPAELPPVAALVKATALDVPFLRVTLPHMLEQAWHPFSERVLLLDRRRNFEGKYARRTGGTVEDLDAIADELLRESVVDRVVTLEELLPRRDDVLARYFADDAPKISPLATTGGPILATLLGLEHPAVDHVAQFDADMLFHATGPSWVAAGLRTLAADRSVWLVMTHAGPPAGPVGQASSLGSLNARRARWDRDLRVWRFATASTRYFLTDRRRLHGKLRYVESGRGCAPLEQCIGDALRRNGAHRATLALDGSWDLHPAMHEPPFPEWVSDIAAAIVRGEVPSRQRGQYDLRLDRAADRFAWAALLGRSREASTRGVARSVAVAGRPAQASRRHAAPPLPDHDSSPATRDAPIAIVIPVRDRAGARVRRCLASLAVQSSGRPAQVLVVSHGSRPDIDDELLEMCARSDARLIAIAGPDDPWRKPLALNVGLRATNPALPFVMTLDADMILAPNFLQVVLDTLRGSRPCFVMCRSSDLSRDARLPIEDRVSQAEFDALRRRARLRGRHGTGGIQAATREFFFEVRGYDEDLVWWGAEDGDMVGRAALAGLERVWICDRTAMLHQWHEKTFAALSDPVIREEAKRAWARNHALVLERAGVLRRNSTAWGVASVVLDSLRSREHESESTQAGDITNQSSENAP